LPQHAECDGGFHSYDKALTKRILQNGYKINVIQDYLAASYEERTFVLSNNFERMVFGFGDAIGKPEAARYSWAAEKVYGNKILEIGCGSGYGVQFFKHINNLDYTGVDYDANIINFAQNEYGSQNIKYICDDINNMDFGFYDTIIAFEILEHLDNGIELAKIKEALSQAAYQRTV
jgi:2-polyprenyl-3-methyl-5-hydroxy-6-metoxy-1,4-benzoquinol methylase